VVGIAALARVRGALAKASHPSTPVSFAVPAHACDCHTHIFGDPTRFPFWPGRSYTPEPALPQEMAALHHALHVERAVIVTPSVYGTDNSATLYGMRSRGATSRGVAVIDGKTPESALEAMDRAGVRGARLNLATAGLTDPETGRRRLRTLTALVARLGWHVQINTGLSVISGLKDMVRDSPVPVVFDHFGGLEAPLGLGQPGFGDLVELVRSGKAYVKLSAAYRLNAGTPDCAGVAPFAKALIAANPDRIVWGTDWPHPDSAAGTRRPEGISPLLPIDDGLLLNQLAVWAPDPAIRKKILVDNPARLYGF
jgi:predicted TIM-barrel fold metal-dependent hydrolase